MEKDHQVSVDVESSDGDDGGGESGKSGDVKIVQSKLLRAFLVVLGVLSVGLGTLGIFLPLLPTTPFFLLATFCFFRSSKYCYEKLMANRWFRAHILPYLNKKGIPKRSKYIAITMIWLSIGFCVIFILSHPIGRIVLLLIATSVSIYLIKQPTLETTGVESSLDVPKGTSEKKDESVS